MTESTVGRWRELAAVFLRLGSIAFGGPVAHVAMMEQEVVTHRQWMSREKLLDLFGVTNLIPGPNSTELAMQIGYDRAGWPGLVIAGLCFIFPAMTIVWIVAVLYVQTRSLPQVAQVLYGINPVIVAIVLEALWKFGQKALKNRIAWMVGVIACVGYGLGWNELVILLGAGLVGWWVERRSQPPMAIGVSISGLLAQTSHPIGNGFEHTGSITGSISWMNIFGLFFKIGSVLYGSGYVLLAFLQQELVDRSHILTSQQLLDAIAIGQLTPGPVLTTATFIGYLLGGHAGAIAGTVGIFLPGFIFVALLNRWMATLLRSTGLRSVLSGVNAASVGLMAGVSLTLMKAAWVDGWTIAISGVSAVVVWQFKINPAIAILIGAAIGGVIGKPNN
jgi:chromate transporter